MNHRTYLLIAAQDGDPKAFDGFIVDILPDLRRFAFFLVGGPLAEDLIQDTCLRILRSLHTFRGDAEATPWALAICRRSAADLISRAQRQRNELFVAPINIDAISTLELRLIIEGLPVDQRDAFVLTQVLGCSYDEAARQLSCPIGTIRSRVARARFELQKALRSFEISAEVS